MDDNRFDRLTRTIATTVSRRGLLAVAAGLVAMRGRGASAAQLGPSTCGQAGAVCTMLMGCCEGLTCVTSAINVNYGICVTGSGGTVSTGTTLISPFSDGAAEEAAGLASAAAASAATAPDPQAEREQRIAQRKSRRSSRKSKRSSRRSTRKTNRQTQKDEQRLRRGPRLGFQVTGAGTADETLRVRNLEDESIYLFGIAPLDNLGQSKLIKYSLGAGSTFLFLSGRLSDWDGGNKFEWNQPAICQGDPTQDGFVVTAAFSSSSTKSRDYTILCDGTRVGGGRPRRGNDHGKRKRKRKSGTHD